jgi:hypothetical protein
MDLELNQCSLGFHPSNKIQNEFFPTGVLVNVDSIWPIRGGRQYQRRAEAGVKLELTFGNALN